MGKWCKRWCPSKPCYRVLFEWCKLKTKKEYDAEVAAILPEDVFRMITNPLYFPTMKAQESESYVAWKWLVTLRMRK